MTSVGERAVRTSFDSMFNFFFKLQYLYRIGLLKEEELYYFKYHLNLAFKDEQYGDDWIWDYIKQYQLPLEQGFIEEIINLPPDIFDNKDSFILNLRTYLQKIFGLQN